MSLVKVCCVAWGLAIMTSPGIPGGVMSPLPAAKVVPVKATPGDGAGSAPTGIGNRGGRPPGSGGTGGEPLTNRTVSTR